MVNVKNSSIEQSVQSPVVTQGLVMVKPHAMKLGLDHVVEALLGDGSYVSQLGATTLGNVVERIDLANPLVRDLSTTPQAASLLRLFYGDKENRPYFPLIKEWYIGKVLLLPFTLESSSSDAVLDDLELIKGTTSTVDEAGLPIDVASGIRGVLGSEYVIYEKASLEAMNEDEYRAAVEPMIQNYIHVCDKPNEARQALSIIT